MLKHIPLVPRLISRNATLSIVKAGSAQKVQVFLAATTDQPRVPALCNHLNLLLSTRANYHLKPFRMKH